tara:strand:+ start:1993 stop:2946 length:954 start_codon:yes stop_codon:yes gene_type:complete
MNSINTHPEIWPKPNFSPAELIAASAPSVAAIERFFENTYPNAHAVLMPSGRSSLSLILQHLGLTRPDLVFLPPYSSHCVINAVGYVGTPTPALSNNIKSAICFHQWGYVHKLKTSASIIEDSVDSLITSSAGLFPNDGRFEILSLSKIYGALSGGIILCQNTEDAQNLRKMRDARQQLKFPHFMMRVMGLMNYNAYGYWNTAEPLNGFIARALRANIWKRLEMMGKIIADRQSKISLLEKSSIKTALPLSEGRLPICWAVAKKDLPTSSPLSDEITRHIKMPAETKNMVEVYPIPIHHDIKINQIKAWFPNQDMPN